MESARTSERLENFYQTTQRYNPEDSDLPMLVRVSNAHAQSIMGKAVIIIPPQDFKKPSRWYH
jgi:hypothetical protein